jgi:hypothetical protein
MKSYLSVLPLLAASAVALAEEPSAEQPAPPASEAAPAASSGPPPAVADQKGSGAFTAKAMREPLSGREVERGLLMPKGWLELSLGYERKVSRAAWSDAGERDDWDSAVWTYQTQRAALRYGLGPRIELGWDVPLHQAHLQNDVLGTDTKDWSVGDPRFHGRFELLEKEAPTTSLALELAYKAPAAKESPGTYIGGPINVSAFVFTTGTPDLSIGLGGKQQFGPASVEVHAAYVRRFSAVVQYLVELENFQFLGRIKPGDLVVVSGDVLLQAGPVALHGGPRITQRGLTRIGTTSGGLSPSTNLDPVAGSDGVTADIDAGLIVNVSRGVDIDLYASLPMMGEDLQFFPIEDIHPTLGRTFGGALELRY